MDLSRIHGEIYLAPANMGFIAHRTKPHLDSHTIQSKLLCTHGFYFSIAQTEFVINK